MDRLRTVILQRWWLFLAVLWLTIGLASLWHLRPELAQLQQYFTWTAVRYGLAYHRFAAVGLGLCIGLTVALLISESRYILFGLSRGERRRLNRLLNQIHQRGASHPLWHRVIDQD